MRRIETDHQLIAISAEIRGTAGNGSSLAAKRPLQLLPEGIPILYLGGATSYYQEANDDTGTVDFDRTLDAAWLAFERAQEFGNRQRRPRINM